MSDKKVPPGSGQPKIKKLAQEIQKIAENWHPIPRIQDEKKYAQGLATQVANARRTIKFIAEIQNEVARLLDITERHLTPPP